MPALSFVLLRAPAQVDPALVVSTFTALFPDEPPLRFEPPSGDTGVLDFRSGQVSTLVALMEAPVPKGEADEATARSVSSFRRGGFTLPPHLGHLLVTTMGDEMKTAVGLTRHTQVVAAITQASKAVGVYEGNAGATHAPDFYVSVATEATHPTMLWNGVSLVRTPERLELLSLGMGQLELPDLLLVAPAAMGNEALGFFFDLLAYVAQRGTRIPAGETVGRDESEKLTVHYVPSPVDDAVEVARVSMLD
ncbi:MAG: DUF4261 domain-containing protein [Myxococcaceae bacterium]|nr:DUF4261 domain-containing protein [Myxococcaceae bacterium]